MSEDRYLTFALGKGRLANKTLDLLEQIGITCEEMKDKNTRKLIFVNEELKLKFFLSKALDVPTYVEYGAADIGVVGIPSLPNGLTYIPFREIQDTFVTTDRYLENLKIRVGNDRKAILNNATFMMLNKENISRKYVDMYLSSHQITMDNIIEINTMDLLIELAKIDLGIACVIKDFVKDELDDHSLTEVSLGRAIPKRKLGLVYKDDTIMTDAMKKFISYFTES